MEALIAVLLAWVAHATGLPTDGAAPVVAFVSPVALAEQRHAGVELQRQDTVVGLYLDDSRTILLAEDWDAGDPADVSALVHELVHHLQNVAGLTYWCTGDREALAYQVQAVWLAQFGLTLEESFALDPITLTLATSCSYP